MIQLDRRLMPALAGAEGMAGAGICDQIGKAGIAGATMFAGVFGLFTALIQSMFALAGAIGMT